MVHGPHSTVVVTEPAIYRIRLRGRIHPGFAECMGSLTVAVRQEGDAGVITELTGVIADQAALMGILDHLYRLNVPLLSVESLGEATEEGGSR